VLIKAIKYIFIIFIVFLSCTVPYIWSVIKQSGVNTALNFEIPNKEKTYVGFEEGSLLKTREFKYFREFSTDQRFDKFIYKNLKVDKDIIEVEEDFKLESLRKNQCFSTRCLQFKVSFPEIPVLLSKGLIGIEDYRFLDHFGLDPISILRALYHDVKAGKLVQGGSTLTQQLAKNLFFTNEKTLVRKLKEAIVAVYIESKFEKSDILRTYFNEVFWGSLQGIRIKGVQAASQVYFGKEVGSLSPYESSILVSMLKGPGYYHPIRRTERLRKRADFIFSKLGKLELYNAAGEKWGNSDWNNWLSRLRDLQSSNILEAIYIVSSDQLTPSQYRKYKLILASKSLLRSKTDVNKNLSVKAIFGNPKNKSFYYSRFERDLERSLNVEKHQIGSTIKPIIYNLLTKLGVKPEDEVELGKLTMNLISGKWTPRESHEVKEKVITYERALRESLNIPVIKAVQSVGFEKFESLLEERIPEIKKPLSEYPAQLLGAVELSISELFGVYLAFVEDECKTGMKIINVLSDPSKTTIKRAVSRELSKQEFFGKTGTTNKGIDNWFIGFDGHDLFVIWTGYEGNRNEIKSLPLYGSSTSFKIYQDIILYSGKRIGARNCTF
jgi:penicillin-binding protein 1B